MTQLTETLVPFKVEGFVVHQFTSDKKTFFTNAFLIETANALVCIDTFMTLSDAQALRQRIDQLGKTLLAVIITHGHPDHYNGSEVVLEGLNKVPVISTQGVHDTIRDTADAKEVKWRPVFGDDWPSRKILPNAFVSQGSTLNFDGLTYYFADLGAAESSSDIYLALGREKNAVFVGDVVFNNMHGFMNDGCSTQWLNVLQRLENELAKVKTLFTGHGNSGEPARLIARQIQYLRDYRREVAKLAAGADHLNGNQKRQLEQAMVAAYPDYQLTPFIQAGADAVAAELAAADGAL